MTLRSMVLVAVLIAAGACLLGAIWFFSSSSESDARSQDNLRTMIETLQSDRPQGRLAAAWLECLNGPAIHADESHQRVECASWTAQEVTSTLVALRIGDALVPAVETHLSNTTRDGRYVVDIVGGPGDEPFHVEANVDDAFFDRLESSGKPANIWRDMRISPYRDLMDHGYTIASVGYWGTNIRTLRESNEIERAFVDVRIAVDYYRDRMKAEPALVTTSLGNHIALGALGQERLERLNVLALVPVMDGLQPYLMGLLRKSAEERAKAEANGDIFGTLKVFNIYSKSGDALSFDRSRMLPLHDFSPRYVGAHDLAWKDVTPGKPCSRIVLGATDPRTRDYLKANNKDLPAYVIVLGASHNLAVEAPEDVRGLFFNFADCLTGQES